MYSREALLILFMTGVHVVLGSVEKNNEISTSTEVSEFSTDSDYNNISTIFNTTDVPITVTTTDASKKFKDPKYKIESYGNELNCSCNLHVNACDIGCCCDRDCTYEMRKIFERCEEETEHRVDRSACRYFETYYLNHTAHEWEIQNNDFFCVAKDNLPPTYTVQKDKPFRSYTETISHVKTGNFWPEAYIEPTKPINYSQPYVQGVPLKYIVNNSTMDVLKLSKSFFSSACDYQSNILYLHEVDRQCVQILNEKSKYLNADFYRNILFIAKPNEFNTTKFRNELLTCPEPLCLKPLTKICFDVSLRNCKNTKERGVFGLRCHKTNTQMICENIVDSFKILISHEGIEGIKNITIFIHLLSFTLKNTDRKEINQRLSVAYEWSSVKLNFSDVLSGNPGYIIGKPILSASLVNGTISRKSNNFHENFLCLPQEDMGICEIGEFAYQPVEFGYNTILMCRVRGSLLVENITNPVNICRTVQEDLMKYWSIEKVQGSFINRTYGLFGNANSTLIDEWGIITYEKSPRDVINNINGSFTNRNKTLECNNLVFGLNIDILHAKVDLKKLVDQEKILGITYKFHPGTSESLQLDIKDNKLLYEFSLDTRITFWDITSQKLKRMVEPPSLNIALPSDFFYPFVKMGNAGNFIAPQVSSVLFLICSIDLFVL